MDFLQNVDMELSSQTILIIFKILLIVFVDLYNQNMYNCFVNIGIILFPIINI